MWQWKSVVIFALLLVLAVQIGGCGMTSERSKDDIRIEMGDYLEERYGEGFEISGLTKDSSSGGESYWTAEAIYLPKQIIFVIQEGDSASFVDGFQAAYASNRFQGLSNSIVVDAFGEPHKTHLSITGMNSPANSTWTPRESGPLLAEVVPSLGVLLLVESDSEDIDEIHRFIRIIAEQMIAQNISSQLNTISVVRSDAFMNVVSDGDFYNHEFAAVKWTSDDFSIEIVK